MTKQPKVGKLTISKHIKPQTQSYFMKGISDIVATFILIALTITMATYLTIGFTQLVQKGEVSSSLCAVDASYSIESVVFNKTGDGQLWIKLTNKGSYELFKFSVFLLNETAARRFLPDDPMADFGGVSEQNPLKRERSVLIKLNLSDDPGIGSTLAEVVMTNEACPAVFASKKIR